MTDELEGDNDFKDAKIGGYVGAILCGGATIMFSVTLVVMIGVALFGTARTVALTLLLVAVPCIVVFGLMTRWSLRHLRTWKRLENRPIIAWGALGEWRSTRTKMQTRNLYVFHVTVTPMDGPPYEAEAKWFFPTDSRDVVTPGTNVVMRIDPDDRSKLVIDWPQSRAAWAAASTTDLS